MKKTAQIIIQDEVHCILGGLHPTDLKMLIKEYAILTEGYFFNPLFKLGRWDGKYKFVNSTGKTYVLLLPELLPKIKNLGYKIKLVDKRISLFTDTDKIDENYFSLFNSPSGSPFKLRYYQVDAVNSVLKYGYGIIVAGTGAGKTLINAAIVDNYGKDNHKTLTIVPTIDLIGQTIELFEMVGLDVGEYSGTIKDVGHTHTISTWQALQNNPKIMSLFTCVLVDECHQAKAKVIKTLMVDNGHNIVHRFGLTGTMPKSECDNLTVRCSIGPVRYTIPSHELISQKFLASLDIKVLQLKEYLPKEYFPDYTAEKKFLLYEPIRHEWICKQIYETSLLAKGNSLVLVNSVAYGRKIQRAIPDSIFLARELKPEDRKLIFDAFETNNNLVVIATVQLAGTGISIDRIFNLFFIDMGKSFIRTIQGVGRGLRKSKDKDHVVVFDICANLFYSAKHLKERIRYYKESKYPYNKKIITYKEEE